MANFKIVISDPKNRKAFQKEIEQKASGFMGKRIGEKVRGDGLGLQGYEFQVTGGSDAQGFPMRKDFEGIARKKVILSRGTGFRTTVSGQRKRKSVRGNTISPAIAQINAKIVTYGSKPIEELAGKAEKKEEKLSKLSEEERKKKLQQELTGMVEEKAPEKSRSEQIKDEMESQTKSPDSGSEKPSGEEKPNDEPKKKKASAKGESHDEKEEKPAAQESESKEGSSDKKEK